MIKKFKKALAIASIASLGLCLLILILSLFIDDFLSIEKFNGAFLYLMISFAIISAASFFSINAVSFINKNKIIGYLCLVSLALSTIGGLIAIWTQSKNIAYNKAVGILAIVTVFFIILVGTYLKLGKKLLVFQLITYVVTIFIVSVIVCLILSLFKLEGTFTLIFIAACIVDAGLLLTSSIISGKMKDNDLGDEYIKIKKSEYEALLARVKELENK